jgi:hypothetical protein
MTIYPSPFNDLLTIGNMHDGEYLSMYDLFGRKVYESRINRLESIQINTGKFASGLYLIIVSDRNGQAVNSIKVEKK